MVGQSTVQATVAVKFVSAGTAACIADAATFPLDTAKVRLQVQGEGSRVTALKHGVKPVKTLRYRGLVGTLVTISSQEGPRALYNGLTAGLQRQMCFASVRIGMYDSVKTLYANMLNSNTTQPGVPTRIAAGITTGGAAVLFAQPTDVVKVRFQAAARGQSRYSGCIEAYRMIFRQEGLKGLWKGTGPNVVRNAVVNVAEVVSYDLIKEAILRHHLMQDNMPCHFVSGFGAGFVTTVIASPVDVVKTRYMNSTPGQYRGVLNCAHKMLTNEGPSAFYKGFIPSFMRLGTWNIAMFVCFEQLKRRITMGQVHYKMVKHTVVELDYLEPEDLATLYM